MSGFKKIVKGIIGQKNSWKLKAKFRSSEEKAVIKKRRDFYFQFLKKGDTYFDVGANFGNRIEPIINEGIKIVAVEPQQVCLDYLTVRYKGDIEIVPKGLSAKVEERKMFIGDSNTISSFSEDWISAVSESKRYGDNEWKEADKIEMTTMDLVIEEFGLPTFVKIDVEGFELEVLSGLSHKIKFISIEYTVPEHTQTTLDCLALLNRIGEGDILINYSIGESMEWAMKEWVTYEAFLEIMKTEEFLSNGFGDIYIETKNA